MFTDGGSRGNPGPGASSALLFNPDKQLLDFTAQYFEYTTNNNAEYQALLIGITLAAKLVAKESPMEHNELHCFLDSELAVKQMQGIYKIKDDNIKSIKAQMDSKLKAFKTVNFTHIPRELNKLADRMVNLILDTKLES